MPEKEIQFRVQRFKQGDAAPHFETFTVPCDEDTTVLIALQHIRREEEPSLMLRHSCHHASCGTCGMKVNGQEELACVVRVLDLDTPTVTVEPLDNIPLVSDLVVDMNPFFERYNIPGMAYIRVDDLLTEAELSDDLERYTRMENCIECGICVSACPIAGSDPDYRGPAALAAAWRVVEEPRESDVQAALRWVDDPHGCWRCHVAFECSEACPSNVDPAGAIMALRLELTRTKIRRFFGLGSR
jgi:succinate dehydrogenase / fumarate reductase iron-sulfur subunit